MSELKQKPRIEIRENQYFSHGETKKVKQIELRIYDLTFRCDIHEERDVVLAKRLASDLGVGIKVNL